MGEFVQIGEPVEYGLARLGKVSAERHRAEHRAGHPPEFWGDRLLREMREDRAYRRLWVEKLEMVPHGRP